MNEIRVKRLLLAGLATFFAWIVVELIVELMLSRLLFGNLVQELLLETGTLSEWSTLNYVVNLLVGLVNSTLLIWLYASLRPMYGVGTRTALIAAALGVVWGSSMAINGINLGLFSPQVGLMEIIFEAIEFPIAMIVGAEVYEGGEDSPLET